jgi:hypothetical protein
MNCSALFKNSAKLNGRLEPWGGSLSHQQSRFAITHISESTPRYAALPEGHVKTPVGSYFHKCDCSHSLILCDR